MTNNGAVLRTRQRSAPVLVLATVLAVIGLQLVPPVDASAAQSPIKQRTAANVTADALPTAQINGVVWSQVVAGDTVFAGGQFTSVRPAGAAAGTSESPRSNLMSYNIRTGVATSFAPTFDAPVKQLALSSDGATLYVGGQFTKVNNLNHYRVAAFSVATGQLLNGFVPKPNAAVEALAVVGNTVYLGGGFSALGSVARTRLAAVDGTTGAVTGWAPTADATVQALVATPDRTGVVAGGSFAQLNATAAPGMGLLDAQTGALKTWQANTVVKDSGAAAAIYSLNADNDTVYATGYTYGSGGNFEGVAAADPSTGKIRWLQDCHGDTYDAAPVGGVVYSVGHAHNCANVGGFPEGRPAYHHALAVTKTVTGTVLPNTQSGTGYGDFGGQPAPSLYNWFPDFLEGTFTGLGQGPWSVRGTSEFLSIAGEFTKVNGVAQQGLTRMAVPAQAPNLQKPRVGGDVMLPTPTAQTNSVKISSQANWDRDDKVLKYDVLRDNVRLKTVTATSYFWNRPTLSFTDYTGVPGRSYKYKLKVYDPDGNSVTSLPSAATVFPVDTSYAQLVQADGAAHQWRLGSPAGQGSDPDAVVGLDMGALSGVTFGSPGAIPGDSDTAATMNGSAATASTSSPAGNKSIEAWFKTTSTSGGALVAFGSANRSGASVVGDREVYLTSSGQLAYAERATTGLVTTTTPATYTDGRWHQVVAVHTADGIQLYVDGVRQAVKASTAAVPTTTGAWYLGGPTSSGLPGRSSGTFNGTLDDVAVFDSALSSRQVRNHYLTAQPGYSITNVDPQPR